MKYKKYYKTWKTGYRFDRKTRTLWHIGKALKRYKEKRTCRGWKQKLKSGKVCMQN